MPDARYYTVRGDPRGRPVDPYDLDRRLRYVLAQQVRRERACLERPLYHGYAPPTDPPRATEMRLPIETTAPAYTYSQSHQVHHPHGALAHSQPRTAHADEPRAQRAPRRHRDTPPRKSAVPDIITDTSSSQSEAVSGSVSSISDTKEHMMFDVFDAALPDRMHRATTMPSNSKHAMDHAIHVHEDTFVQIVDEGVIEYQGRAWSDMKDNAVPMHSKRRGLPFLGRRPSGGEEALYRKIEPEPLYMDAAPNSGSRKGSIFGGLFRRQQR